VGCVWGVCLVFVVVGVWGFWGVAKPQAVSRCARLFGGVGWCLVLRRKRQGVGGGVLVLG